MDFRNADGSPTFRDFDLAPLLNDPGVEMTFLEAENVLSSRQLEDIDALILLAHRFDQGSVPRRKPGRASTRDTACTPPPITPCVT